MGYGGIDTDYVREYVHNHKKDIETNYLNAIRDAY